MLVQKWMRVLGVAFVLIGALGFFFPLEGVMDLTASHNLVHLLSGIVFLGVSGNQRYSMWTARIFGIIYLLAAILGLFVHDVFHVIMATGWTEIVHFVVATLTLYAGFKGSVVVGNFHREKM
jgi:hypothetical protein